MDPNSILPQLISDPWEIPDHLTPVNFYLHILKWGDSLKKYKKLAISAFQKYKICPKNSKFTQIRKLVPKIKFVLEIRPRKLSQKLVPKSCHKYTYHRYKGHTKA